MRKVILALALTAPVLALTPGAASAGVYDVNFCKQANGAKAPVTEWHMTAKNPAIDKSHNTCSSGGALQFWMDAGSTHAANDDVRMTYHAPPDTEIAGYSLWRTAQLDPNYNYAQYEILAGGTYLAHELCRGSCPGLGAAKPFDRANLVNAANRSGVQGLQLRLTCGLVDSSSGSCPATKPAAVAWLHRAAITLRDEAAPVFSSPPTGPLVSSSGQLAGVQPVSISATDKGGGVYQALVEVDGSVVASQTIDDNDGACEPPFTQSVPCKISASATIGFDTSKLADGAHSLRLLVTDATGTNTAAWGPITIRTANATCNPDPVARSLRMTAGVPRGKHRLREVTMSYGHRVRVRGRLVTPAGAPVAGAILCVASRADSDGAPLSIDGSTVTTDATGRFAYLAPSGPSRRLFFVYRTPEGAVRSTVVERVRAPATLSTSRRSVRTGQTIRFSGSLRSGPVPRRGVLAEIQARRPTGWQTFGTARSDSRGRFHLRYHFVRTRGVRTYTFRALVPHQGSYPFATGMSHSLRVVVRG